MINRNAFEMQYLDCIEIVRQEMRELINKLTEER